MSLVDMPHVVMCVLTHVVMCSAPVGDSHFGRLDAGMLVLRGEDRLPQLGPITAFAMGTPAQCGTTSKGDSITRGGNQLLACVGHGRSGALAVVQGAINPQQDGAVDFQALGQCTGNIQCSVINSVLLIDIEIASFVDYFFGKKLEELYVIINGSFRSYELCCVYVHTCM